MTIGESAADAGPSRAQPATDTAATDAAAKINLRMFPPAFSVRARFTAVPKIASGTNTDMPPELPLPL
jgi:hypothetical protein